MTLKDLIPGNIYTTYGEGKEPYIFRSGGGDKYLTRLAMFTRESDRYAKNSTFGSALFSNLRLPTQEEILQLEACEKFGKYQKIKIIDYEIY